MSEQLDFAVLQDRAEIEAARSELERRGLLGRLSWIDKVRGALLRGLRRTDFRALGRPDPLKSWDVRRAVGAIETSIDPSEAILDVGSLASAIPPALSSLGYGSLHGIDLDERVLDIYAGAGTEYVVGDLTATGWPDGSFAAITAISVIEHGVSHEALFAEVSRLLRPGGMFLFSTDYWPDKIDTSNTPLFGLPWTIFSAPEIEGLLQIARGYGLAPMSDPAPQLYEVRERPIRFADREYTFLYGALLNAGETG
jgi:SAM-dependent methyltransferase